MMSVPVRSTFKAFVSVPITQLRKVAQSNGGHAMSDGDLLDIFQRIVRNFQEDGFWEEFAFQVEQEVGT